MFKYIFLLSVMFVALPAISKKIPSPFVSTKYSKVNMRAGPGLEFPIKFIYLKINIPLMVLDRSGDWVKVQDVKNDEGWISRTLLSNERYAITTKLTAGYDKANDNAEIKLTLDPMVLVGLKKCNSNWCLIRVKSNQVWVKRNVIWGVLNTELTFN